MSMYPLCKKWCKNVELRYTQSIFSVERFSRTQSSARQVRTGEGPSEIIKGTMLLYFFSKLRTSYILFSLYNYYDLTDNFQPHFFG